MKTLPAIAALFLAGCASTFHEPSRSQPHALITFERMKGIMGSLGGQEVLPLEINELPPNEWTKWNFNAFKVEPGSVRLLLQTQSGKTVEGTLFITFEAVAGKTYHVTSSPDAQFFNVTIADSDGEVIAEGQAEKHRASYRGSTYVPIFIPTN